MKQFSKAERSILKMRLRETWWLALHQTLVFVVAVSCVHICCRPAEGFEVHSDYKGKGWSGKGGGMG